MSYANTVLLTGGTTGLGYYAALNLAKQHPKYLIIITGRSDPKSVADTINAKLGQKNVAFLPLELSSISKVRNFAESWTLKAYPPIISLILNAGVQYLGPAEINSDGYEKTFAINHLGHALLFYHLIPYLSPDARVVVTASGTHNPESTRKSGLPDASYNTAEALAHPDPATAHPLGMQRYNSSKLANILWTYALARHLAASNSRITANAFNPGLMPGTGLGREWTGLQKFMWFYVFPYIRPLLRLVIPTVRETSVSGKDLAQVALGKGAKGVNGRYFDGRKDMESSKDSYDEKKQEDLWTWTLKAVDAEAEGGLAGLKH